MILMLGLAGSGKSTQCQLLANEGSYQWLSIGQLLRTKVTEPHLKQIIDSGDVLSDSIVVPMVAAEIDHLGDSPELILDGFPRTMDQVHWLHRLDKSGKIHLSRVLHLTVSEDIAHSRLLKRGRSDDHDRAIQERFNEYESSILPIINYLRSEGLPIFEVDGTKPAEEVHRQILNALTSNE